MPTIITFLIGAFAGACAVFVPRIGGLLVIEDMTRVTIFPVPFIAVGLIYAAIIGAVVAIMYHGVASTPRHTFVAALGIPALLAGALTTGSQTGVVKNLQANNSALAEVARKSEDIKKFEAPFEIVPLDLKSNSLRSPGSRIHELFGIGTALAEEPANPKRPWGGLGAVQVREPTYAVIIKTVDANSAFQTANKLKQQYPEAQAIKTPDGFGVYTSTKPESFAVLEAVKIKQESGFQTQLMRISK